MSEHIKHEALVEIAVCRESLAAAPKVAEHLEGCEQCRAKLEELKAVLTPLAVLHEDVEASRSLVEATVASVGQRRRGRIIAFTSLRWAAAAAAIVVIGLSVTLWDRGEQKPNPTTDPVPAGNQPDFAAMRAEKPFAPASAIELNVLPTRDDVQLTIYNSADLTLVRERRNLTLKQGWNWMQYMWANTLIDATSLELRPLDHASDIEVDTLVFPPRLKQLGRWPIFSKVRGSVPFEITYLTSGLSWRAFYMGTLSPDERSMDLEAYVRVSNASGEDYDNAQTRLVVGQVNMQESVVSLARRPHPYGTPLPRLPGQMGGGSAGSSWHFFDTGGVIGDNGDGDTNGGTYYRQEKKKVLKEGLSEYVLYSIEGRESIPNGWGKRLPSMKADSIPVVSLYKFDEERWGANTIRFLSFVNDEEHALGTTPLPQGAFRGFRRTGSDGLLSYVGQAALKYIPIGEDVEMELGTASLASVAPVLMEQREENHTFDGSGNLNGWDELQQWVLKLDNPREIDVSFEVTRGLGSAYWQLEGTLPPGYTKHDATHARFEVDVAARSRHEIKYTVRIFRGRREAALMSQKTDKGQE